MVNVAFLIFIFQQINLHFTLCSVACFFQHSMYTKMLQKSTDQTNNACWNRKCHGVEWCDLSFEEKEASGFGLI